jgi:hypothetical protein
MSGFTLNLEYEVGLVHECDIVEHAYSTWCEVVAGLLGQVLMLLPRIDRPPPRITGTCAPTIAQEHMTPDRNRIQNIFLTKHTCQNSYSPYKIT